MCFQDLKRGARRFFAPKKIHKKFISSFGFPGSKTIQGSILGKNMKHPTATAPIAASSTAAAATSFAFPASG